MRLWATAELSEAQSRTEPGTLPEWDLSDLYPGPDSEALASDLAELLRDAEAFSALYRGRLAGLSGAALGAAIESYEKLQEKIGRIMSYASLMHAGNLADPELGCFYQTMQERTNAVSTTLLFFTLELNRIEDADLEAKLTDPALARYRPWLRDTRAFRPHQLSDEIEKLLHEKYVAGRAAWVRLFDETIADLRFPFRGKELTESEALDLLSDNDPEVRREAALSIGEVLGENIRTFALITNTLAKDKEIEDRWRRFPRPISSRNLANFVEDEVVDALIAAVCESYPQLSHRYYKLKRSGSGSKSCRSGTGTRRCPSRKSARSPGPRRRRRCCLLTALSRRKWPQSVGAFSPGDGSMHRSGPARRRVRLRIRRCRARTPICCSITRARSVM